jgi:hypothetical protein
MMFIVRALFVVVTVLSLAPGSGAQPEDLKPFAGTWVMDMAASSDIDPWREVRLEILVADSVFTLIRSWRAGRYGQEDSVSAPVGGGFVDRPIRPGKWFDQVYEGAFIPEGAVRRVRVDLKERGRLIQMVSEIPLEISQGVTRIHIHRYIRVSADGTRLVLYETRSSRGETAPIVYLFGRTPVESP